jgi:hypothetical protein
MAVFPELADLNDQILAQFDESSSFLVSESRFLEVC